MRELASTEHIAITPDQSVKDQSVLTMSEDVEHLDKKPCEMRSDPLVPEDTGVLPDISYQDQTTDQKAEIDEDFDKKPVEAQGTSSVHEDTGVLPNEHGQAQSGSVIATKDIFEEGPIRSGREGATGIRSETEGTATTQQNGQIVESDEYASTAVANVMVNESTSLTPPNIMNTTASIPISDGQAVAAPTQDSFVQSQAAQVAQQARNGGQSEMIADGDQEAMGADQRRKELAEATDNSTSRHASPASSSSTLSTAKSMTTLITTYSPPPAGKMTVRKRRHSLIDQDGEADQNGLINRQTAQTKAQDILEDSKVVKRGEQYRQLKSMLTRHLDEIVAVMTSLSTDSTPSRNSSAATATLIASVEGEEQNDNQGATIGSPRKKMRIAQPSAIQSDHGFPARDTTDESFGEETEDIATKQEEAETLPLQALNEVQSLTKMIEVLDYPGRQGQNQGHSAQVYRQLWYEKHWHRRQAFPCLNSPQLPASALKEFVHIVDANKWVEARKKFHHLWLPDVVVSWLHELEEKALNILLDPEKYAKVMITFAEKLKPVVRGRKSRLAVLRQGQSIVVSELSDAVQNCCSLWFPGMS